MKRTQIKDGRVVEASVRDDFDHPLLDTLYQVGVSSVTVTRDDGSKMVFERSDDADPYHYEYDMHCDRCREGRTHSPDEHEQQLAVNTGPTCRPPAVWCEVLRTEVLDPDGWRDGPSWETPITRAEFEQRAARSTVRMRPQLFDRLHDDIEAVDPARSDERRVDSGDGELLDRYKSAAAQARVGSRLLLGEAWYEAFEEAERKRVFARALADVERVCAIARREGMKSMVAGEQLDGVRVFPHCEECDELIVYVADTLLGMPLGWMHVEVPDEVHRAVPACSCDRLDTVPNAYCRQHGIEDVVSGAYDANPDVRRHVDAELARGVR